MTDSLDSLIADIDALEDADDEDDYPWYDAWSWTAEPDALVADYETELDLPISVSPAPRLMPRDLLDVTLSVVLADGRTVSWSASEGWDGDTELITAAQAVAGLHTGLTATTAVARGLVAVAVDGHVDPVVWLAAGL
ncbi:hypothetical protein [Mycolicibacterium fortuitum]|uniref:hypothetical protein n=1 Tax=Mycolicibacterium fortuitum TaxID=1766 RepID=UPI001CDD3CC9|nr:hypothetical protein [Mycolicibacterium fortuitum]UBV14892.1 hypothetical protein H8Z57_30105 [Mycolicibacterium fortuitum]